MPGEWIELLDATANVDGRLLIEIRPPLWVRDQLRLGPEDLYPPDASAETWIDVRLTVEAHPVSAIFEDVWFATDLEALGAGLLALAEDSRATSSIAGNRALELRLGGGESCTDESLTIFEATVLGPSADAPCVQLTWWPGATEQQLILAGEHARDLAAEWQSRR